MAQLLLPFEHQRASLVENVVADLRAGKRPFREGGICRTDGIGKIGTIGRGGIAYGIG